MTFHLTVQGEAVRCTARLQCPYGTTAEHYASEALAVQDFKTSQHVFAAAEPARLLTEGQALVLWQGLRGESSRVQFMRAALEGYALFGDSALVFACMKANEVAAAACLLARDDEAYVLDYIGSRGGGAGSLLVEGLRAYAAQTGLPIYLESTADSDSFWRDKMKAACDTEGLGVEYYRLPSL